MSKKSKVFEKFKDYVSLLYNKSGRYPNIIRYDNGGEYTSTEVEQYLKNKGIEHQLTVPQSPSQNGVAERKNR